MWGKDKTKVSRKKNFTPLLSNLPVLLLCLKEPRFPWSPCPWRRKEDQSSGLNPLGIKAGLGVHETISWPLLAFCLPLSRPVLISVPKNMGPYISYFIGEIQELHLKFRYIYWNNTPARRRRRELGNLFGSLHPFPLNSTSSRRSCRGLEDPAVD